MTDLRRLEDQVTEVLRRQADGIDVPPRPDLDAAVVSLNGGERRRWRWPVAALSAAAALAVVVAVVVSLGTEPADRLSTQPADEGAADTTTTGPATTVPVPAGGLEFATRQVSMTATGLAIEAGGERFVASGAVEVRGDPGMPNSYTTLELTWTEHGKEMRLFLYFTSDGVDWWANEIRTYNGASPSDWITYTGEFVRTPLGQPFTGDVDLHAPGDTARLQLTGLRLQAFLRPASCDSATGKYALEPTASSIVVRGGYGFAVTLLDAATCSVAGPNADIAFEWRSDDPSVITVVGKGQRADLMSGSPGRTKVHIVARDGASGEVVAETTVDVESGPSPVVPEPTAGTTPPPRATG